MSPGKQKLKQQDPIACLLVQPASRALTATDAGEDVDQQIYHSWLWGCKYGFAAVVFCESELHVAQASLKLAS